MASVTPIEAAWRRTLRGKELARPLPPLDYLVEQIGLTSGSGAPHLVAGYGYSGKSIALQSMLLSLAAGRPVWGCYKAQRRRVLHVDFEQGERETCKRYQRLAAVMFGVRLEDLEDWLEVEVFVQARLIASDKRRWLDMMAGRDMVVIDSLRAASPNADENDSAFRSGLDLLGQASEETGCRAVIIHHSRKAGGEEDNRPAGQSIRGSSAIFDACDGVYVFAGRKGEPVRVTHEKARSHGECVEDFALRIENVSVEANPKGGVSVDVVGTEEIASSRAENSGSRDGALVLAAIRMTPGLNRTQLTEALGMPGDRFQKAIDWLGSRIRVEKQEKSGKAGRPGNIYFPDSSG